MRILLTGLLLLAVGCTRRHVDSSEPVAKQQNLQTTVASSQPRGFVVNVSFSEKAMKKLTGSRETVIVAAYLSGTPKQGALKQYVSEIGDVGLGNIEMEVLPGQSARFEEVKPKQDAFEQTDQQSPELLINVFSGRKSSGDNLLDCGIYEGKLDEVAGRNIPIACKLIRE